MQSTFLLGSLTIGGLLVLAANMTSPLAATPGIGDGDEFPDVTASRVGLESFGSDDDFHYYGQVDGIAAFSIASTSCNVGNTPADWIDQSPLARNPVIAQNLYRLHNGRFEHIGMSWVKHSFCAVNETTCGTCIATSCNTLGVGCADTYWATLNGSHNGIGPRWEINPMGEGPGGVHDDIYVQPDGPDAIRGRLQVDVDDIIDGAQYFVEIHYVTHDEPFDKRWNNASHRAIHLTPTSMAGVEEGQESVQFTRPAIEGWRLVDPAVRLSAFEDVPGEGRFNLASRAYDNGDGTWTYEYALHNMNSHRGARSFSVPAGNVLAVTDIGFHDVDYHSGDGEDNVTRDGTDWPGVVGASHVTWETQTHDENPNANALLWGTVYNFRFTTNMPPTIDDVEVGLFRPGSPDSVTTTAWVPLTFGGGGSCGEDIAGDDGVVDTQDLLTLLANWGADGPGSNIAMPHDVVDTADLLGLLAAWGDCD